MDAADRLRAYLALQWTEHQLAEWVEFHGDQPPRPDAGEWSNNYEATRTYNSGGELSSVELLLSDGGPATYARFAGRGALFRVELYTGPVTEWVECYRFSTEILEVFDNWAIIR